MLVDTYRINQRIWIFFPFENIKCWRRLEDIGSNFTYYLRAFQLYTVPDVILKFHFVIIVLNAFQAGFLTETAAFIIVPACSVCLINNSKESLKKSMHRSRA